MTTKKKDNENGTDTHDTMVNRDTITNINRAGFPLAQFVTIMITLATLGIGGVVYIVGMKGDIALVRQAAEQVKIDQSRFEAQTTKEQARFDAQLAAQQKIITDGMTLRIQLQGDVKAINTTLVRIEEKIDKHMDSKSISLLKSDSDFIR